MRLQTVHSNFHAIDFFTDMANAKRVDSWFLDIIRGAAFFKPLRLVYNVDGQSIKLIEHGVISSDAEEFVQDLIKAEDVRLNFPNDEIDVFIDLENKFLTVNIVK